jgi:uncharacterized protein (DUF1697 family)
VALTTHIALLRGVNVGGRKPAPMADLRRLLADLSFEAPRSLLQSGNLVFRSEPTGAALEALLERECGARLGLSTTIMVRTAAAWRDVIATNPLGDMAEADPSHLVVMALKSSVTAAKVEAVREAIQGRERVEGAERELYIAYPDGIGSSKLTGAIIERRLGVQGTARNWNTVLKLAALAGT